MDLVHTIYEPPGDGPHPTLLVLHGWGANALDLLGLAPHLAAGRFLVLCPAGAGADAAGARHGGLRLVPADSRHATRAAGAVDGARAHSPFS